MTKFSFLFLLLALSACGPQRMLDTPDASALHIDPQAEDAGPQAEDAGPQAEDAGPQADAGFAGFPCDVREILQRHCAGCHAGHKPPIVNFSSRDAFLEESQGVKRGFEMMVRLGQETMRPMPPYGIWPTPTETHRLTLGNWVDAGMPAGNCGPLTPPQ